MFANFRGSEDAALAHIFQSGFNITPNPGLTNDIIPCGKEASGLLGVLLSGSGYEQISGAFGWILVNDDFDGDNLSDYVGYQETLGLWYGCLSSTG
jgi:hypothetical protein